MKKAKKLKPSKAKEMAQALAGMGQNGDTILAHINPQEAMLLESMGGSGQINPRTGLPSFAPTSLIRPNYGADVDVDISNPASGHVGAALGGVAGAGIGSGLGGKMGSGIGGALGSAMGGLGMAGALGGAIGSGLGGYAGGYGTGQAWGTGIGSAIGSAFGPIGSLAGGYIGGQLGGNYDNAKADAAQTGPAPGEVEANDSFGGGYSAGAWGSSQDGPMGSYAGDMGGSGGSGGSGSGGDSVICTELFRQGLISREYFLADAAFGQTLPLDGIRGYHVWAKPIVRLMRRSPLATKIAHAIATPWVNEMARRQAGLGRGSVIGASMLYFGVPVCILIAKLIRKERVAA